MPPRTGRGRPKLFCSRACQTNRVEPKTLTGCVGCGAPLPAGGSRGHNQRQWCSEACRVARYRSKRSLAVEPRPCVECGTTFLSTYAHRKYCSKVCRNRVRCRAICEKDRREFSTVDGRRLGTCSGCGCEVPSRRTRWCRACEKDRLRDLNHRRRVAKTDGEIVRLAYLIERDRGRCGICHKKVDVRLSPRNPKGPTIDHIVPVSAGGVHSLANCQLAHAWCNGSKNNRPANDQLRLVG